MNLSILVNLDILGKRLQVVKCELTRAENKVFERLQVSLVRRTAQIYICNGQYLKMRLIVLLIAQPGAKDLFMK